MLFICHFQVGILTPEITTKLLAFTLPLSLFVPKMADVVTKVAIIPGNGCTREIRGTHWYGWLADEVNNMPNVKSMLRSMPDPIKARESIWIPFMKDTLEVNEDTIVVGHSSGAEAAMRFAEKYKVKGIILVSACVTDLGLSSEAISGYYNRPWGWDAIKANSGFIVQFGSHDDPFIPWNEQASVHEGLSSELHEFEDKGHFMFKTLPEVLEVLKQRIAP